MLGLYVASICDGTLKCRPPTARAMIQSLYIHIYRYGKFSVPMSPWIYTFVCLPVLICVLFFLHTEVSTHVNVSTAVRASGSEEFVGRLSAVWCFALRHVCMVCIIIYC